MNLFETMRSYFVRPRKIVEIPEVQVIDVYFEKIWQILSWRSKENTLKVFFWLNTLFWLILMFKIRFLGVVSLLTLIIFVYDLRKREVLFEEYTGEFTGVTKQVKSGFIRTLTILKNIRTSSPCEFYSILCIFFMILISVSRKLPGHLLTYAVFLSTFFLPVGFQFLPDTLRARLKKGFYEVGCFIEFALTPHPDQTRSEVDASFVNDRTMDPFTLEEISTMPSYSELTETPEDIDEDDFLPELRPGVSLTPGDLSSDSESETRDMKFDSDHFNTSSSEEDPLTKNLSFSKSPTPQSESEASVFKSVLGSVGSSLMETLSERMFKSAVETRRKSGSDSDFEIIDADELEDEGNE